MLTSKYIDSLYETLNDQRWDRNHFFLATWILLAPWFHRLPIKPKLFVFLKTKKNEEYFIRNIFSPLLSGYVYHSWSPSYKTFQIKHKPFLIGLVSKRDFVIPFCEFFYSQETDKQSFLIIGKNFTEFYDLLKQKKELVAWLDLKSFFFELKNFLEPGLKEGLKKEVGAFFPIIEKNIDTIESFLSENFDYQKGSSVAMLSAAWFAFALKREVGKKDLINFTNLLRVS